MTIVNDNVIKFLPQHPTDVAAAPSFTSTQVRLNSATDVVSYIFFAPKAGAIRKVGFRTGVVGTGCTIDVRLETLDEATGLPSGTLVNAGANVNQVISATDDNIWFEVTLGTDATVTEGQWLCLVFRVASGTPADLRFACFLDSGLPYIPYIKEYDGTWSLITNTASVMSLEYADGTAAPIMGNFPIKDTDTYTFNNTNTPDVIGIAFSLPYSCQIRGFWVWIDNDAAADYKLIDSDGVTVLASRSLSANIPAVTSAGLKWVWFAGTPPTVQANTQYFIVVEPTTSTNLSVYGFTAHSSVAAQSYSGGDNFKLATAKNPAGIGDWTIDSSKRLFAGILASGIDIPAGGGEQFAVASMS